jgi:NAD+ kinase
MKVGIYSRTLKDSDLPFIDNLLNSLQKSGIDFALFDEYQTQLSAALPQLGVGQLPTFTSDDCHNGAFDFILSIGGDGTLLNTITLVKNSQIPVLGINTGRLGLLTDIGKNEIAEAWQLLLDKAYIIDTRRLLELQSEPELFPNENYALNELTLIKQDTSAMIIVHAYIDGEFLNSYWADGVIVSTPTGSTAYSMSCGGPIVHPNSRSLTITPIAPHNLNVRPVVVPDTAQLTFKIEGRSPNFLCTLDSRYAIIDSSYAISVSRANFDLRLVRLHSKTPYSFFSNIRKKLMWGQDTRN